MLLNCSAKVPFSGGGEMAGDPVLVPLLLGLSVEALMLSFGAGDLCEVRGLLSCTSEIGLNTKRIGYCESRAAYSLAWDCIPLAPMAAPDVASGGSRHARPCAGQRVRLKLRRGCEYPALLQENP